MGQQPAAHVAERRQAAARVQEEYSLEHPDERLYRDDVEEAIHQESTRSADADHRYGSDDLGQETLPVVLREQVMSKSTLSSTGLSMNRP